MSGRQNGESPGAAADSKQSDKDRKARKGAGPRSSDLGRALRSIYDDTLREPVPDDFSDLLGKLS